MGFKCPVCHKDFGIDKDAWQDHLKNEHNGVGKDIEKVVRKIAGETNGRSGFGPSEKAVDPQSPNKTLYDRRLNLGVVKA